MRILLVAPYFPPRRSSFPSRWAWLAPALADRGHSVEVLAMMSGPRQPENLRHVLATQPTIERLRVRPILPVTHGQTIVQRSVVEAVMGVRALVAGLKPTRTDVVVVSVPNLSLMPVGWLLARIRRRPLVLDLRDAWPEILDDWHEWNDDGQGGRRPLAAGKRLVFSAAVRVGSAALSSIRRSADAVVVTSEGLATHLQAQGATNVTLVRNTSVKPWPYPLPPRTPDGELHVLYLGNVGRAQLLATAIRATAIARQRGTQVVLRVVGTGPHWAAARKIARETGAPVEFIDRVPITKVLPHYEWADTALVILRDWNAMRHTVPSKVYEVMLSGRHISASLHGDTTGLVESLGAGDVVPPEDPEALADLWCALAADRSRLQVSTRGRTWVQTALSPERLTDEFEAVLRQVIDG